jgi:hypothetical protein
VSEPEFTEVADDEAGDEAGEVEWLETAETLAGGGRPPLSGSGSDGGSGGRVGGSIGDRVRDLSRPKLTISAIVVVLALAATSLILRANHVFGPSPDSGTSAVGVDWRTTLPEAGVGMWTTADSVVIATASGLTAYSLSHGSKLWSWAAPAGEAVCNLSPTTSQGRGVVALGALPASTDAESGSVSGCAADTAVQAIDLGSGRSAWPEPVDVTQGGEAPFGGTTAQELSISQGFVVAPYGQSGFVSLDAATGDRLWTSDELPDLGGRGPGSCANRAAQTLDDKVYTLEVSACGGSGVGTGAGAGSGTGAGTGMSGATVHVYSAAKPVAVQTLPLPVDSPQCSAFAHALFATAANPAGLAEVFVTCTTYSGQSFPAYVIRPDGAQMVPLALQSIGGIAPAVTGDAQQLELVGGLVSGGTLVVESAGTGSIAALTGVTLSDGSQLWRHVFPAGSRFFPLGSGGGEVQGVQITGSEWTLLSITAYNGATTSTPLDSAALSGSDIDLRGSTGSGTGAGTGSGTGANGSFSYSMVGSQVVAVEFGVSTSVVVSTL